MENVFGDLTINIDWQQSPLRVDWKGKSNDRQPAKTLDPFFAQVTEHAMAAKVGIEMHFEHLDYFNSSTISTIIQLIQDLRRKGVTLEIVFDAELKWQKLSFEALRIFEKPDGLLRLRALATAQ